ncbi:MAG: hypothetical protein ABFQ53_00550, partial [Patescibacteria group bacterium]
EGGGAFKDMLASSEGVEEVRLLETVLKEEFETILKRHGEVAEILKKDFSERITEIKTKLSEVDGSLNKLLDVFDSTYVLQKELEATLSGLTTIPG